MNLDELVKIIHIFESSSLATFEMEENGVKLRLTKDGGRKELSISSPLKDEPLKDEKKDSEESSLPGEKITSPLVGTYHEGAYSGAEAFVKEGASVKKGQKLCMIEAMKVMNEITAPKDGKIIKIYKHEGAMVEYNEPLFIIGD